MLKNVLEFLEGNLYIQNRSHKILRMTFIFRKTKEIAKQLLLMQ